MKKEQRFCESCMDRLQSWTMRCAGFFAVSSSAARHDAWSASFLPSTTFSASTATKRWRMAPWRGSVPSVWRHSWSAENPGISGSKLSCAGSIFTVSKGVAFDTTALRARMTLPLLSRTPQARPPSTKISATCVFREMSMPNCAPPRCSARAMFSVPPLGTE